MPFVVKPSQRLVFAGDSITDCGRRGAQAPLGNGYVRVAADLIAARHPAHRLEILNAGVGGDTIRMLAARWEAEVIAPKPDWVTLLIGVNDAWGWLIQREGHVSPGVYREIYGDLLERLRAKTKARLVLMDPFMITRGRGIKEDHQRMLKALPRYRATVAAMAKRFKARHVPLQKVFDLQMRHRTPVSLAEDAVHPTQAGHVVLAHAWLGSVGW
ncbi:MAG: SGNH/GDSL hydrolase family protein [Planctomycetota bacterium]|nr:SGNH/GDSL hydrolase family protein [Planctomycetota bacterium]